MRNFLLIAITLLFAGCTKQTTLVSEPAVLNANYIDVIFTLDDNPSASVQFPHILAGQILEDATNDASNILVNDALSTSNVIHAGKRYISATFEVTNNTGADLPNLYFLGRDAGNGKPFKDLAAFDGTAITTVPASMRVADAQIFDPATNQMVVYKSDYQTGLDIANSSLQDTTGVFDYGFLAQNSDRTSTTIADGATGRVTFSVVIDDLNGTSNDPFSFRMTVYMASDQAATVANCGTGTSFTCISTIQGDGANVTTTSSVDVEAIVVGDYQEDAELDGFFIQEEDADADADVNTSEGIFVYCGSGGCASNGFPDVAVGDKVQVTGAPTDFNNMSQIVATQIVVVDSNNPLPSTTTLTLPAPVPTASTSDFDDFDKFFEKAEGMLVKFSNTLSISEYYALQRFGQIVLYEGGRPFQYTNITTNPTQAGYDAYQLQLQSRRITFDDGSTAQNPSLPAGKLFHPQPNGFGVGTQGTDFFRGGDTITNLQGVLQYSFGEWRVQPVAQLTNTFTVANPRSATPPTVDGNIKVVSFNVLNYFTTLDNGSNNARGANSATELTRQRDKLVQALNALDADIFGLIEIENGNTAINDIVTALNAISNSTYAAVNTGQVGGDAIMVGFIYKTDTMGLEGSYALATDTAFVNGLAGSPKNRPAVAQTFKVVDSNNADFGQVFTVVVNHLKSKGSDCGAGDDSTFQGNCNGTRNAAADYLVNTWIPSKPTGTQDPDYLIIGDLNAYAEEQPISTIKDAGYTDLVRQFGGIDAYSYVFNGRRGYLDHALANTTLTPQVKGTADWHINADEASAFDYNDTIQDAGERDYNTKPSGNPLYEANAFRTSDHDPVIIGLDLDGTTPVDTTAPTLSALNPADDATNVPVNSNLEFTFNENVQAIAGTITIYKASDDSVVEQVATSAATFSGRVVTVNPASDFESATDYYVTISAGFEDVAGNAFAGFSDKTAWNFRTAANSSGGGASEILISEYVEGSGTDNKYIEIFNGTGADINLADYSLAVYRNGDSSALQKETSLMGMLANGAVKVYGPSNSGAYGTVDATYTLDFNGNDPVLLLKNGTVIDTIGVVGSSADWGKDQTFSRNATVCSPSVTYDPAQWSTSTKDDVSGLGSHIATCP